MELDKTNAKIAGMFDNIAPSYDFLNHLLSFNIDKCWRKKTVKFVFRKKPETSLKVLDLACGTGDLSGMLYAKGGEVTGLDISEGMLNIAKEKNKKLSTSVLMGRTNNKLPQYISAGAESLPFNDNSYNAATIAFGIRNFENRELALNEIKRVLIDNGDLAILEFAYPKNILAKGAFNLYFKYYLPIIGKLVSKDKDAYKYLVQSVEKFPKYEDFCSELKSAGFSNIKYKKLSFGIACLYMAQK